MRRTYRGKHGKGSPLASADDAMLRTLPSHPDEPAHSSSRLDLLQAAFQIHHGPAQHLASTLMCLRLCESSLRYDPSRAPALIRHSIACTQAALDSVRAIICALQHPQGKGPEIASFLRATIEELRMLSPAAFQLDAGNVGSLPPALAAGLAAVGREALTNAARHAGARHITATLSLRKRHVILRVSDDGRGFEHAEPPRRGNGHESMGLNLMKEQIEQLGGTLHTRCSPPGGTLVEAIVPVPRRSRLPIADSPPLRASLTH